eukprot:scaffold237555_cov18-Prasinocladus_malaysianus.AAC.1
MASGEKRKLEYEYRRQFRLPLAWFRVVPPAWLAAKKREPAEGCDDENLSGTVLKHDAGHVASDLHKARYDRL